MGLFKEYIKMGVGLYIGWTIAKSLDEVAAKLWIKHMEKNNEEDEEE